MGQYLNFGIATTIYAKKNDSYTPTEIKNALMECLNLEIYTMHENKKYIYLLLKEDIFMKNYEKLIKKEYKILNAKDSDYEVFDEIKDMSYGKLLKGLQDKNICYSRFQFTDAGGYYTNNISYILYPNYNIEVSADIITYYLSEKVLFEGYYDIFSYIRNKIISSMDNPLKDAVFVTITG